MRNIKTQLLTHVFLIIIALITLYPFAWMVSTSLKTESAMWESGLSLIPDPVQWENYARAWRVADFSVYLMNTVIFAAGTVILSVAISSTSGYILGRFSFPGKHLIFALIISTLFIPRATTIIPIFSLVKGLGLLNTRIGMILAFTGGILVLNILLFSGFFQTIPKAMEDSAKVDGCSFPQTFRLIMLPLTTPMVVTITILNSVDAWKTFLIPLVFTFSRPNLRTLGVGMYAFIGEFASDWTGMAAGATISIIPIIIIFLFLQKYFIEGLAGAIKG